MEGKYKNYNSFHMIQFLFLVYSFILTPQELLAQSPNGTENACESVNCGQGKCVPSAANNDSILGLLQPFDCVCNAGWKKMQIGLITFEACTIPNCTVNYECGNGAPPAPLPPPPPANSPINISPCMLAWCGDGICVADGIGYTCKCNEGSDNLFNLTAAACFQQCYLGSDCNGVALGSSSSLPTPSGNYSPPPPPGSNSNKVPNCSIGFGKIALLSLCLIFMLGSNLMWGEML